MKSGEIPQTLLDFLLPDEEIISWIAQNKLKHPISQIVVAATNQRVVVWIPTFGGMKHDITTTDYRDIDNVEYKKGFVMGSMTLFYDIGSVEVPELDNKQGSALTKVITGKIREAMRGEGDAISKVLTTRSDVSVQGALAVPAAVQSPLDAAKVRLAAGEITVEEFKELSELLS